MKFVDPTELCRKSGEMGYPSSRCKGEGNPKGRT